MLDGAPAGLALLGDQEWAQVSADSGAPCACHMQCCCELVARCAGAVACVKQTAALAKEGARIPMCRYACVRPRAPLQHLRRPTVRRYDWSGDLEVEGYGDTGKLYLHKLRDRGTVRARGALRTRRGVGITCQAYT